MAKKHDLSRLPNAPRRKHGTNVAFVITCASCKQEAKLDYVPRGVPIAEMLCNDCMAKKAGAESRHALVSEQKADEAIGGADKRRWDFQCDNCGKHGQLPFEPAEDRTYYCTNCYDSDTGELVQVDDGSPKGEKTALAPDVFVRKKKTDS